jgi:hypothetical protein
VLQGLVDETVISPKDGRVRFYGYEEPRLTTLMQEYRLEGLVRVYGLVTRNASSSGPSVRGPAELG